MTLPADPLDTPDVVLGLAAAPGRLLAARLTGLYQSADAGRSWVSLFAALPLPHPPANCVAAPQAGLLLVGTPGGILRSTDDGTAWTLQPLARPVTQVSVLASSPAFATDGTLFAGTVADGVFVSTDRGRQWQAWNISLFDPLVLGLAVSPDYARDATVVAATATDLYVSRNGGRRWQALALPGGTPAISASAAGAAPSAALAIGTEAGQMFISADLGGAWQPVALAPAPESVVALEFWDGALYVLTEQAVLRLTPAGSGWSAATVWQAGADAPACFTVGSAQPGRPQLFVGDVAGRLLVIDLPA